MGEVVTGWNFSTKRKDPMKRWNEFAGEPIPSRFLAPGKEAWFTMDVLVIENQATGLVTIRPEFEIPHVDESLLMTPGELWSLWTPDDEYHFDAMPQCIGKRPCTNYQT